jgi:Flp pilus assembly protein TadD
MRRRFINTAFVIAVAAAVSATAAGQAGAQSPQTGRVSGTVFDPNRAVVAGAHVYLESGGVQRHLSTNDEGFYDAELPPGNYSLFVGARGFCPSQETGLRVAPGTLTSFDVTLRVAQTVNYRRLGGGKVPMLVDAVTDRPCTLETPAPAPGANGSRPPHVLAAYRQTRGAKRAGVAMTGRVLNLSTQPGAVVWVDEVRRGAADTAGKLQLKLTPGRHSLRVRAKGFAERTLALLPTQRGALPVVLTKTTDEAELLFQQAEEEREKGNNVGAVELYRQALGKRARYAAAHLGLARSLESQENFDEALEELQAARRDRPVYPESWAVEGRIQRSLADHEAALAAYRRALREARGFQPEAHTGMGIAYEDKGRYEEAVEAFRKAVAQLSDTEPVLYELLARNLERLERWKEAVAAYEKYLELAPQGAHASAVNSIIDQLRKQAAEAEQQAPPEN